MLDYKIMISVGTIILLIILLIVMILCSEGYINTQRNERKESDEIREDFPQNSPMNVLYSDANGNLSSTNDLGLQNLTVAGRSQLQGVVIGDANLSGPDGKTWITKEGITFGGTDGSNNGRQADSAQISAGKHDPNSLCIVGMSSDTNASNRRITMWAEGGAKLYGGLSTTGSLSAGNTSVGTLSAGNTSVGTLSAGTTTVGGLSASSISSSGNLGISGTLSIPSYTNVKNTLDDLYAKISALDTRVNNVETNAIFYDTPYKTLINNAIHGYPNSFVSWGNCDECSGGADKIKLWPNASVNNVPTTSSLKFVKTVPTNQNQRR